MEINRVRKDVEDVFYGKKPVKRTNPKEGQSEYYYIMPKDDDPDDYEIIDVESKDTPNPRLQNSSANSLVTPEQTSINPLQTVQNAYQTVKAFVPTVADMAGEYFKMKDHEFRYLDDYHHCKANFNVAQKGRGAANAARIAGDIKEGIDYYWNVLYKGLSPEVAHQDMVHDLTINRLGLSKGRSGKWNNAKDACAEFRDSNKDFPEKYW